MNVTRTYRVLRNRYKDTMLGREALPIYKWLGYHHVGDRLATILLKLTREEQDHVCKICGSRSKFLMLKDGATYFKCVKCSLVQSPYYDEQDLYEVLYKNSVHRNTGRGELFLVEYCNRILGFDNPKVLLLAPGRSPTFEKLRRRGVDVYAADIADGLPYSERFVHLRRNTLPDVQFDIITAVEVIEHHDQPVGEFSNLIRHLSRDGVIAVTTDLYHGGIPWNEDYVTARCGHLLYFHHDSLIQLCELLGLECVLFEEEWSRASKKRKNKRVVFLYRKTSDAVRTALAFQHRTCPILSIWDDRELTREYTEEEFES